MKKIIKRIVSCVLFVAILLGLLQVSSLIFQPKSNDKASGIHYPRANGIFSEPKDSIDTVFIGDSEVYHSFIPLNIWRDYGIIPMFLHRYFLPTKSISTKLRNSVKSTVQNLC